MVQPFTVIDKKEEPDNAFILRVKPATGSELFSFKPGQYCELRNPFAGPTDLRPFSIASSPDTADFLEFCIKMYGDWTHKLNQIRVGGKLEIDGPFGEFTWDDALSNVVFLVGGTGIAPIMSMLRTVTLRKENPSIILLYGNRTPETIIYKNELESFFANNPKRKLVHIFSHLSDGHHWQGHRGFITSDILMQEVDLSQRPVFLFIGPPIFIEKMQTMLHELNIREDQMKQELLSKK